MVLNSNKILIGNNRLAIIDQLGGQQPMASIDNKIVITFNGEVFNSRELRESLEKNGVIFKSSHSDTEVILHMYQNFGIEFLKQINGMFAIIIVDLNINNVFIIRDRFGIKPLFYRKAGFRLIAASDMRAIKILSADNPISMASVMEFMSTGFISNPDTVYENIKSLPPATYLNLNLFSGSIKLINWWTPPLDDYPNIKFDEAVELVRTEFINAVKRWTNSDFPIALSLSGGIDSSSILIACNELKVNIKTFFMGFIQDGLDRWDETPLVDNFTKHIGMEYVSTQMSALDFKLNIKNIANHLEQPYGGGIPSWKIFSDISQNYKVALNGTGGDELFGNYNRGVLADADSFNDIKIFKSEYINKFYKIYPLQQRDLFEGNYEELFVEKLFSKAQKYKELDFQKRTLLYDVETQLTDEFLFMIDKLSMMHSVEARTPFLDHIFFESIIKIPSSIRNIKDKYKLLLSSAFADVLLAEQLSAPKKGFSIPISIWFRGELQNLLKTSLLNEHFIGVFHLNKKLIESELNIFLSGDNSRILFIWRLFMLSQWFDSHQLQL
jgi:asparagine synthase (glutamine-hydrolysing)